MSVCLYVRLSVRPGPETHIPKKRAGQGGKGPGPETHIPKKRAGQGGRGRAGQAVWAARAGQGKQFLIFGCSSKNICNTTFAT
jgi:hypothetical protein